LSQNPPLNDPSVNDRDELIRRIRGLEERCRQTEEALRTSQEQHRFLADSSPLGIIVVDIQGRILRANQKMLDILAWPANRDITQLNIFEHAPLVDSGSSMPGAAWKKSPDQRSSRLQGRDGYCHLRYHVSPLIQNDEECSGIIAFVEDVTELKLAEESIMAKEEKYRRSSSLLPWP
jgi:PAS domain S-box-containing protein